MFNFIYLIIITISILGCNEDKKNQEAQKSNDSLKIVFETDSTDFEGEKIAEQDSSQLQLNFLEKSDLRESIKNQRIYTIQVSSWDTLSKAEKSLKKYTDNNFEAYIQKVFIRSKNCDWYRVRVGTFVSEKEAKKFAEENLKPFLQKSEYWIDFIREED